VFWRSFFAFLISVTFNVCLTSVILTGKASLWWFALLAFYDLCVVSNLNRVQPSMNEAPKYIRMPIDNKGEFHAGN